MNQKELSELARFAGQERHPPHLRLLCQRQSGDRLLPDESMGRMPGEESAQYLGFLKKTLSGTLGQAAHRHLSFPPSRWRTVRSTSPLRPADSQLKDAQARRTSLPQNIDALSWTGIIDPPGPRRLRRPAEKGRPAGGLGHGVLLIWSGCVCPVKDSKGELGYFPGEFVPQPGQPGVVAPPERASCSPWTGRAANLYNALFYSKKADQIHQEFMRRRLPYRAPHVRRRTEGGLPVRPAEGAGGRLHGGGGPGHPRTAAGPDGPAQGVQGPEPWRSPPRTWPPSSGTAGWARTHCGLSGRVPGAAGGGRAEPRQPHRPPPL